MTPKFISNFISSSNSLRPDVKPSEVFAWASLDFANSGYTTVVLTAVFNAYFVTTIMEGSINATLVWTSILSISYLMIMITAPWLGAYADYSGNHKLILYLATFFCSFSTILLGFCSSKTLILAGILLVISNFSYSVHQDIAASYLINFCKSNQLGRVSGFGWSWGFVGGITTLILSFLWIYNSSYFFNSESLSDQVKVAGSMIITGVFFGVVSLLALTKLKKFKPLDSNKNWKGAWLRIIKNSNLGKNNKDLYDFLLCIFVYQAGIAAVITIAAIYAKEVMSFSIEQTIIMILIVNVTACVGAFGFGFLQDLIGHKKSLLLSLILWLLTVILIFLSSSSHIFWIAANFAGLAMGASQSGARAAVAHMSPINQQAENFGLWGFSINAASAFGPLIYGLATFLTKNNHQLSILVIAGFFVVGIFLLLRCKFRSADEMKKIV